MQSRPEAPLYDIPGNPRPDGISASFLVARDGHRLRYALASAPTKPAKGTVLVLPGRNETIEKYFETLRDLGTRGFATVIADWRGQGGSDRLISDPQRGHIGSFETYRADLMQFIAEIVEKECPPPYFILAHSAGGLVALLAAPELVGRVRRIVLSAPLLSLPGFPVSLRTIRRIAGLLRLVGLGRIYSAGGPRPAERVAFLENKVTTDFDRYDRNQRLAETHPPLGLGGPTISWLHTACVAMEKVQDPDFMARIHVPTLFVAAGSEEVVSTPAIESYAAGLRSGSLLTIDGARHELLQEADIFREQFFAAFDAFVPGTT